ncbi:MAG: cytochrome P450 [Steroidobacteraceae bacterium]
MSTVPEQAQRPSHVPAELVIDFDVYNPPNGEHDFYRPWEELQNSGVPEIVWTSRNGGHWLPTTGQLVFDIWGDHERFSNRISIVPKAVGEQFFGIPQSLDPPLHMPFRMLLNSVLGPKAVKTLEDGIRALAISLIDDFRARGQCDFTREYAEILPVHTFLRLVDLPLEDAPQLLEINNHIIRPSGEMTVMEASNRLRAYLQEVVERRLGRDGQDMLSKMINGQVNGRSLTVEEGTYLALTVLQGGIDTVSNLLAFAMHFLATHPQHRRELIEHPELVPAAVEELVRRFPVVATAREVKNDMTFHGVEMKKGDVLVMATPFHAVDTRLHDRPLEVDFHRTDRPHVTFGNGMHRCPGAHLARHETRITLQEWLARIPHFELADSDVRFQGGVVAAVLGLPLKWNAAETSARP